MGKRLTDESIIQALITHGSIKAASTALGCTVRTLYTRMKSDSFTELYKNTRAEMLRTATAQLQKSTSEAVETLVSVMRDKEASPQTRCNAASNVLTYAVKLTEVTDVLERLEQLESEVMKQ